MQHPRPHYNLKLRNTAELQEQLSEEYVDALLALAVEGLDPSQNEFVLIRSFSAFAALQ